MKYCFYLHSVKFTKWFVLSAKTAFEPGVPFCSEMREVTAIAYFMGKMVMEDLGYKGNLPENREAIKLC